MPRRWSFFNEKDPFGCGASEFQRHEELSGHGADYDALARKAGQIRQQERQGRNLVLERTPTKNQLSCPGRIQTRDRLLELVEQPAQFVACVSPLWLRRPVGKTPQ